MKTKINVKDHLLKTYPAVFDFDNPQPLAIGLGKEIQKTIPMGNRSQFRKFMKSYCESLNYLRALAEGRPRIDIDGTIVEPCAPYQIERARAQVTMRLESLARESIGPSGKPLLKLKGKING